MPHYQLNSVVEPQPATLEDRLDSWKAIAQHLGRSVRTVQRWKRTAGLPVHHVNNRIRTVYASRRELDFWLDGQSVPPEADEAELQLSAPAPPSAPARSGFSLSTVGGATALAILLTVSTLGPGTTEGDGRAEDSPARVHVLRGQAFLSRPTPTDAQRAIDAFERAIEHDADDATAYAGLAQAYSRAANFVLPAVDARRRSFEALNRALALDSTVPEAYVARGLLLAGDRYDLVGARAAFAKAGGRGGSAVAKLYGGMMLIGLGQAEAGLREIERAHRQDPLNMNISARLGMSSASSESPSGRSRTVVRPSTSSRSRPRRTTASATRSNTRGSTTPRLRATTGRRSWGCQHARRSRVPWHGRVMRTGRARSSGGARRCTGRVSLGPLTRSRTSTRRLVIRTALLTPSTARSANVRAPWSHWPSIRICGRCTRILASRRWSGVSDCTQQAMLGSRTLRSIVPCQTSSRHPRSRVPERRGGRPRRVAPRD